MSRRCGPAGSRRGSRSRRRTYFDWAFEGHSTNLNLRKRTSYNTRGFPLRPERRVRRNVRMLPRAQRGQPSPGGSPAGEGCGADVSAQHSRVLDLDAPRTDEPEEMVGCAQETARMSAQAPAV